MKQIISIENNNFDTWQRWSQIKMLHTLSPLLYIYSKQINYNGYVKLIGYFIYLKKKSRIRETKHLSTDRDISTDAIGG